MMPIPGEVWQQNKSLRTVEAREGAQGMGSLSLIHSQPPLIWYKAPRLQMLQWPQSWEDCCQALESSHQGSRPKTWEDSPLISQLATLNPNPTINEEDHLQVFHRGFSPELHPSYPQEPRPHQVLTPKWQSSKLHPLSKAEVTWGAINWEGRSLRAGPSWNLSVSWLRKSQTEWVRYRSV